MFTELFALGIGAQQPAAELALNIDRDPVRGHQTVEKAEWRAHVNPGVVDGGNHRVDIPSMECPRAFQDEATCRQQVFILVDTLEKVFGADQGLASQFGGWNREIDPLP